MAKLFLNSVFYCLLFVTYLFCIKFIIFLFSLFVCCFLHFFDWRRNNEVFIDYDDTIIIDNKYYNTEVIQFIFECKNRNIKITLLTYHEGDIDDEYDDYKDRTVLKGEIWDLILAFKVDKLIYLFGNINGE